MLGGYTEAALARLRDTPQFEWPCAQFADVCFPCPFALANAFRLSFNSVAHLDITLLAFGLIILRTHVDARLCLPREFPPSTQIPPNFGLHSASFVHADIAYFATLSAPCTILLSR